MGFMDSVLEKIMERKWSNKIGDTDRSRSRAQAITDVQEINTIYGAKRFLDGVFVYEYNGIFGSPDTYTDLSEFEQDNYEGDCNDYALALARLGEALDKTPRLVTYCPIKITNAHTVCNFGKKYISNNGMDLAYNLDEFIDGIDQRIIAVHTQSNLN